MHKKPFHFKADPKKSKPLGHEDISATRFINEMGLKTLSPEIDSFMINGNNLIAFNFKPERLYKAILDKNTAFFFSDIVNKNKNYKVFYYDGYFTEFDVVLKRYVFEANAEKSKLLNPVPVEQKMTLESFSTLFRSLSKLVLVKKEFNKENLKEVAKDLKPYQTLTSESNDAVFNFYYNLSQKEPTASFNVDMIHYTNSKHILIELLKCDEKQKTVTPHSSHPNRYLERNYQKFTSIYKLAKMLQAEVFLINYAETRTSFQDYIGVIHSFDKDNDFILNNIAKHKKLGKKFVVQELYRDSFKALYENKIYKVKENNTQKKPVIIQKKSSTLSLNKEKESNY